MTVVIVILSLVFIVAVPLLARRQRLHSSGAPDGAAATPSAGEAPSCGLSDRCTLSCDQERLVEAPEYYDDEELDAYRGIPSDRYTGEQIEVFEEVLTTMRPEEVHGWLFSLQKRGVELPDALKDEAFMLING